MSGSEMSASASSSAMDLEVWLASFFNWSLLKVCDDGGKDGGIVVFEVKFVWFASGLVADLDVLPVLAKLLSWKLRVLSD